MNIHAASSESTNAVQAYRKMLAMHLSKLKTLHGCISQYHKMKKVTPAHRTLQKIYYNAPPTTTSDITNLVLFLGASRRHYFVTHYGNLGRRLWVEKGDFNCMADWRCARGADGTIQTSQNTCVLQHTNLRVFTFFGIFFCGMVNVIVVRINFKVPLTANTKKNRVKMINLEQNVAQATKMVESPQHLKMA